MEKDFLDSWDKVEEFYINVKRDFKIGLKLLTIIDLIAELRKQGYDKQLRAGQSVLVLVLSRSRKHGLRLEQPTIRINLLPNGKMNAIYRKNNEIIKREFEQLNPDIEELLAWLIAHPID